MLDVLGEWVTRLEIDGLYRGVQALVRVLRQTIANPHGAPKRFVAGALIKGSLEFQS